MRVMIFSSMFPKKYNASSGIFIIRRLEALFELEGENDLKVDFIPISPEDGFLISLVKRFFGLPPLKLPKYLEIKKRSFKTVKMNLSVLDRFRISKGDARGWLKYAKSMAEALLDMVCTSSSFSLIHAHRAFPEGYAARIISLQCNVPYVVTVHGGEIHSMIKGLENAVVETLQNASKVIFVSEFLKKRAMKLGYSGDNAVVIPNGYDPSIFHPMNKEEIRKKLGIYRENTNYVGFVGNLIPIKRADKFPEIFHYIAKEIREVIFIVVGDGTLKKEVEEKTRDLKVIFTGRLPQEEVAEWMNAMDVMILPSRNEGWPCVVLEAQACGTAVVGSSNGGIPEAIGFEEFVVEEGEDFEKRFAKRVVEVLEKGYERKKLLERAKGFAWESIVKREVKVYKVLSSQ